MSSSACKARWLSQHFQGLGFHGSVMHLPQFKIQLAISVSNHSIFQAASSSQLPSLLFSHFSTQPLLKRWLLVLDHSAIPHIHWFLLKKGLSWQLRWGACQSVDCSQRKSRNGAEHPPAWLPAKPFPLSGFCVSWEHVSDQPYKWKICYFILGFNSSFFGLQENSAPSKAPWDSFKTTGDYQHYTTINVLDTEAKDALELRPAEWEKCLNLPLDVQEGDFQTEV